jgi:hypothetical protein
VENERLKFLFGPGVDPAAWDLDDVDVRSELLECSFPAGLDVGLLLSREIVANQIYADDPPEVWAAARRLLGRGFDRPAVFHQLGMVFSVTAAEGLRQDAPFARDRYAEALASLPLPSAAEIEAAVVEVVREHQGIGGDELDAAVLVRLGRAADDAVVQAVLDRLIEDLTEETGPLAWWAGDRTVHVGDLTEGIVLTHRLTESEQKTGELDACFDLAGFARREQLTLADGEALDVFADEQGQLGWAGPPGWLERFEAGALVAVRVDEARVVHLEPAEGEPDPGDLPARVRAVYDIEVDEPWLPVTGEDLVLGLQFEDRASFRRPRPPLSELCAAAGLERRGDLVAHDGTVWHTQRRSRRIARALGITDDGDTARKILRVIDLADLVAGVDPAAVPEIDGPADGPALRDALAAMADGEVLSGVAMELFDGPEPGAGARAAIFVEALVAAAGTAREVGVARFLASIQAERSGDLDAAEGHLQAGFEADPGSGVLIDRLAWYASDRGDAARAVSLWRRLPRSAGRDQNLADVEPFATLSGERQGRNQPCWCGSGRKYKHCHLGTTEAAPLPERVGWLCRKAVCFLERRGGSAQADVYEIAQARAVDPDDPDSVAKTFEDPIVMDLALSEGGWFERFVAERGPLLPDDEALLARSWLLVERTVYEVGDVRPGDGLVVRDLRTGEEIDVRERTFSRQARPGALICARAVPDGARHQFVGGLFPVAPGQESDLLDLLDEGDPVGIAEWVARLYRPPVLQTREGEALVECEIVVDGGDAAAARSLLDANYEPDEETEAAWAEMFPLDEDEHILRARLRLDASRASISTNSEERAERILAVLRAGLPGLRVLSDQRRPIDVASLRNRMEREGATLPSPRALIDPDDPQHAELVEQIRDRMERRWCDESVPALNGLTPRQAAADPTRRENLIRLIASFEAATGPAGPVVMRPERLRDLLGLT